MTAINDLLHIRMCNLLPHKAGKRQSIILITDYGVTQHVLHVHCTSFICILQKINNTAKMLLICSTNNQLTLDAKIRNTKYV